MVYKYEILTFVPQFFFNKEFGSIHKDHKTESKRYCFLKNQLNSFVWEAVYSICDFWSGFTHFSVFGINGIFYCIPHNYNHF